MVEPDPHQGVESGAAGRGETMTTRPPNRGSVSHDLPANINWAITLKSGHAAWRLTMEGGRHAMKVATWQGGHQFSVDHVPEPVPGPGHVLVEVRTAGICGTDVHATQGLFPWRPPLVMGHEYTGAIVDVGPRVAKTLIGRAVACEPSWGCGECPECQERRVSHCPHIRRAGGFSERVVLPAAAVHTLP